MSPSKGGITNNLNLGLVQKLSFWGRIEKLRLGFDLLMLKSQII